MSVFSIRRSYVLILLFRFVRTIRDVTYVNTGDVNPSVSTFISGFRGQQVSGQQVSGQKVSGTTSQGDNKSGGQHVSGKTSQRENKSAGKQVSGKTSQWATS